MTSSPSRTVRVFLSSTFRDFGEERDWLVRKVFPELRRRCRARQVTLVDVDLRWGITEAEAQQGRVLPICLAEIDHARPFFLGLLGERYGWIPEPGQYAAELLEQQSWLREHQGGRSVTELEVLHGVLNNPAMAGQALFYFRDPAYAAARGRDYAAESAEHRQKLQELKERIRQSGFPVVEDYPDPATVAQRIGADLWRILDAQYPLAEVPDALTLERQRHDACGASRLGLYLGGEGYLKALDEAYGACQRMVLIRGASGGGKSALLANWLETFQQQHPQTRVFVHHLGATSDAGEPDRLVRRWIQELARALGETVELPTDPEKLFDELPVWLAKASALGRWVMVLDGLDKLRSGRDLRWLPTFLPEGVQLVASCLDGEVLAAAQRRHPWERELAVEPLGLAEQRELVRRYLGTYRKSLTAGQEEKVLGHPLAGNPLFLKTVLEELRVHGVHEGLDERIHTLLGPPASKGPGEAPTVDDVLEHVLERVEADNEVGDVRRVMSALWASRGGLAQDELLGATGVAPARWAGVQLGLEEMLLESGGRWTFAHDYARKAVQDRYLTGEREQHAEHVRLAGYFGSLPVDARVAEELPWQWEQAGEQEKLKACLTDRELFMALHERDEYELLGYWVRLRVDISAAYEVAWGRWGLEEEVAESIAWSLANFLRVAGYYRGFVLGLRKDLLRLLREKLGPEHPHTLMAMNNLGDAYYQAGRLEEALALQEEVLRLMRDKLGPEQPETLMAMGNLAGSYNAAGRLEEALVLSEEVLRLMQENLGPQHSNTLTAMRNVADSYRAAGRLEEALRQGELALRLFRQRLGAEHPDTLSAMNNLAAAYHQSGRLGEALGLIEEVLRLRQEKLGPEHPDTFKAMRNLAISYRNTGQLEEALRLEEEVLRLSREKLGPEHPDTLSAMHNLAVSYSDAGRLQEALGLEEDVLELVREKLGPDHPNTLKAMRNLAISYGTTGQFEEALELEAEVLRLRRARLGPDHPDTHTAMQGLAAAYHQSGRLGEALGLFEEVLLRRREKLGPDHPETLIAMGNLASSCWAAGRFKEAVGLREEVLRLSREKLGMEHPDTLRAMNNLAITLSNLGRLPEAVAFLRQCSTESPAVHAGVRYNLACYECLSGNPEEARRLITEELAADPAKKEHALQDADLTAIHDFIRQL